MKRVFHTIAATGLLATALSGRAEADVVLSGPDSNDGDPHAYASDHQRAADDAACDAHGVTRNHLSEPPL